MHFSVSPFLRSHVGFLLAAAGVAVHAVHEAAPGDPELRHVVSRAAARHRPPRHRRPTHGTYYPVSAGQNPRRGFPHQPLVLVVPPTCKAV